MTEFTDPDGRRYVVVGSTDIAHKSESSLFIRRMTDPLILIQVMKGQGLVVDVDRFRICLERQDEVRVASWNEDRRYLARVRSGFSVH